MPLIISLIISIFCLSGCVSTYTALQELEPGLNKPEVRINVGRPSSVGRSNGLDRWTYKFRWESQEYTRDVFFDDGRVFKVGPLTPFPNYKKKLVESESIEEYEINATLFQKQKEKGFRDINSLKKKTNNDIVNFCFQSFPHSKKQECIKTMTGKSFSFSALQFCTKKLLGHSPQMSCLHTISNKQFKSSTLRFCNSSNFSNSPFKLKCLSNAGYSPLSSKDQIQGRIIW